MSLVVSVGGKIESYFSFKDQNLNPVSKSNLAPPVKKHEEEQERGSKDHNSNRKDKKISESYGRQPEKPPQRKSRIFAKDIMSSPVRTLKKESTVLDAIRSLQKFKNNHLLILEDDLILGIVSDRDLLSYGNDQKALDSKIENIMSNEVILAKEDTEIKILAKIMLEEKISSIPILDDDYQLKGIITKTDLLKCILKNMPLDVII